MNDYLKFVWNSAIHPNSFVDLPPAFQLTIFIVFCVFAVKAFIEIWKFKNNK
jgi:hypothetical protein